MELNEVRAHLHASEGQLQGSAEIQHDSSQEEIARAHRSRHVKRKLNDSQAKIRELESAQQNQVDIDALEARHREERQSLGARVAELEREISAGREKLQELETLRAHVAESDRVKKPAREIQHHEQAAARLAGTHRGSRSNGATRRAAKTYNEVLSKHASLAEMQRELQQDLSALARLMGAPSQPPPRPACLMLRVRRRRERARLRLNARANTTEWKQNQKKRGALAFFRCCFC